MRTSIKPRGLRSAGRLSVVAAMAVGGVLVGAAPAHATATKTVAFYSMDESSGATVLVDSSGNGKNGTIGDEVATGTLYAGATGHRFAVHLPEDKEYVPGHVNTVPHTNDFNPDAGDFSFTIRYRTTYSFGNIMQKGQGSQVGGYWKFEAPGGSPKCLFRGADGASRTGYMDGTINDGQWHTVTCNRTSAYVEMFVDGVRTSRLNGPTGTINNPRPLSIGGKSACDGATVTCDYFVGDIDYIKILKGAGGAANANPVANLAPSCTGLICSLSGSGSTDSDGAVQNYAWNFGDGTSADTDSVPATSHTFAAAGTYSVTLTVTDDRGATDTDTQQVTVAPIPEKISFVGQATANANATQHAVTVPSSVQAGDRLLLVLSQNTHATAGAPAGVTGWTQLDRLDGGYATTTVWTKVAAAGDAGTQVRVTLSAQSKGNFVVAAYRGVGGVTFASATDIASSAGRITPTTAVTGSQSWGVSYWMHGDAASTALTAPAGVEVRSNSSQTGGGRVTGLLADSGSSLPTGSYGGLTATAAAASTTTTTWTFILQAA
ncbi:PKD domain-containing protein [Catellatospora sp. KI3]|uniref:PKD domain-containing protein n=1 Tax=Catellatospora sp. KI3 TaxID=3041620 RepID=UPI00248255B3|nr:PKD domain-containing protein [Catellatospora sp. KI3]MDI1464429.1 PKD domain-containing protein [Catellatospora sp. KI3]